MAKKSVVERDKKRVRLATRYENLRATLKAIAKDEAASPEERFDARLKLAAVPRNSAPNRQRLRCAISGLGTCCFGQSHHHELFWLDLCALRQSCSSYFCSW